MEKYTVTFLPDNKKVEVEKDKTILSASLSAGVYINAPCGGEGVCGRCKVIIKKGNVLTQAIGKLTPDERKRNVHLACASIVQSDLEVEVPAESRLNFEGLSPEEIQSRLRRDYSSSEDVELVQAADAPEKFSHRPLTEKIFLSIIEPTLDDKVSDLERLERHICDVLRVPAVTIGLSNIKFLGELLRSSGWKVTVTVGRRGDFFEIEFMEAGDTSARNFGVCFDIGTTTVSCQLVNLNSGEVLGTKATYNKQAAFGSDVISRIMHAQEEDGLEQLHEAVTQDMNQMIQDLIVEHQVDLNDVTGIVCAGNTTMIHLLLRVDPTYIRRHPYVPTLNFAPILRATDAELRVNPRGLLACVPGVSSYVGGDVTAGVLSSGLYRRDHVSILIDIGTNGEIVLGNKEFLISAAASAGPAFEGSGLSCGMRAAKGAIQKVAINPQDLSVHYQTIGQGIAQGICGSGYIDSIAEMLKAGVLDKDGKLRNVQSPRIRQNEFGKEFVVVFAAESQTKADIVITEADIENLKRAKGAIYAATAILVKHLGFTFSDIDTIFIAGGFGTYLNMENAITIGLLPDIERSKFNFIGNSSLDGAQKILLSADALALAGEIAKKTTYFELSVESAYMDEYMAALFFPHTDLSLFKSVKLL
ncbi:MAG TPA: ASKHA domain-containing protein [Candidatus Omnitrophota bacterium]|nr:ASKHA domain-containing protein [Candidatus Omnitrophota bacterium]HNX81976.1 ASKHA domain-containing protein [Candidatus Omnitrophota bacterium]